MMAHFNRLAYVSLIALIFLCLAWELWLAPLRLGGSMLVLKVVPLLLPLRGLLRSKRYTHQWMSMLALLYLVEGLVRVVSDAPPGRWLALGEVILAMLLFVGCTGYARTTRAVRPTAAD